MEINKVIKQETTCFETSGPKLLEVAAGAKTRKNIVKSREIESFFGQKEDRVFTEGEGIDNLINFIDTAIKTAKTNNDPKKAKEIQLFKENMVFVGEHELKKATQGIASHLIDEAQTGKDLILFPGRLRSERYISLRIMEEIDYLTEENPELRERFKISANPYEIADEIKDKLGNCKVIVPDDFVLSGTRIKGFAGTIINPLMEVGFDSDKALDIVEAAVVAMPYRPKEPGVVYGSYKSVPRKYLNVFSFYSVPEYRGEDGKWVVYPGVSVSGSHSSTDYGFEEKLEDLQEYMNSKNVSCELPLLANITRPYELEEGSGLKYKDKALQNRWDKIQEKYGLRKESK